MPLLTVSPSEDVASIVPRKGSRSRPLLDPPIVKRAITDALVKLNPRHMMRSEEHTSELQSLRHLVCRLLLEKKKKQNKHRFAHVQYSRRGSGGDCHVRL